MIQIIVRKFHIIKSQNTKHYIILNVSNSPRNSNALSLVKKKSILVFPFLSVGYFGDQHLMHSENGVEQFAACTEFFRFIEKKLNI